MPTHKVFVLVTRMSTDHHCAKLESYSMLLYLNKRLYLLCSGMFYEMMLIDTDCIFEYVFMQRCSLWTFKLRLSYNLMKKTMSK